MSPYRTARTSARWAAPRSCAACAGPRRAASCTRGQRSFPAQKWTSPGKKVVILPWVNPKNGDFTMVYHGLTICKLQKVRFKHEEKGTFTGTGCDLTSPSQGFQ